ncbi:MAG: RHS repeat-associated core domain-containing protein, partial [Proteobacteria bacterium]|nr:RHS repeat-associated core domain-containing protein [Verrucomicrobiota bacterium]NBU11593.1 RHS repeat-associated core domain-containing protein [Pseudomonadota bacterium]
RFDAYRWDAETGFYQVRYRYLHPNLGRWISRDPIFEIAGSNLYAYAGNGATNHVDTYGLCCEEEMAAYTLAHVAERQAWSEFNRLLNEAKFAILKVTTYTLAVLAAKGAKEVLCVKKNELDPRKKAACLAAVVALRVASNLLELAQNAAGAATARVKEQQTQWVHKEEELEAAAKALDKCLSHIA